MSTYKERLQELINRIHEQDDDIIEVMLIAIDQELNLLMSNDLFGTEGQSDPRGDFRDGEWSVWHMRGFDDE